MSYGLKILVVFATDAEAEVMKSISGDYPLKPFTWVNGAEIHPLITGVGGISTAWGMKQWLSSNDYPDLAVNAGIAGSYNAKYKPGAVVMPVSDCFADLGIENGDKYLTLAEAGFMNPDQYPFEKGIINASNIYTSRVEGLLPAVKAATVNTVTGTPFSLQRIKSKFNPDIETMEGATFFYICAMEKIPFLAMRAISNMVEPDRKKGWDIPVALGALAGKLEEILNILITRDET